MGVADGRRRLDLVEQAKDDRTDALLARAGAARSDRARGAREVQEVRAFGLVELKGAGQRFEHELGGAADLAALQAPVVVGADAGSDATSSRRRPGTRRVQTLSTASEGPRRSPSQRAPHNVVAPGRD
jgi:hypothetical protein